MIDEFYIVVYREDDMDIRVNVQRQSHDGSYCIQGEDLNSGEMRQVLETVDAIAELNNEE